MFTSGLSWTPSLFLDIRVVSNFSLLFIKAQLRMFLLPNLCACYFLIQVKILPSLSTGSVYWMPSLCQGTYITLCNPPPNPLIHRWRNWLWRYWVICLRLPLVMSFSVLDIYCLLETHFGMFHGIVGTVASGKSSIKREITQSPLVNSSHVLLTCQRLFSPVCLSKIFVVV